MKQWLNQCHFGDVRAVLRKMIAAGVKVQCIVTSPPYWGLRDYGHPGQLGLEDTPQEYVGNLVEVFDLCHQVLAGAPSGGIVLDPFFGSGTTGQAAQNLGRNWIGIEINEANKPLQEERLRQPGLMLEAA